MDISYKIVLCLRICKVHLLLLDKMSILSFEKRPVSIMLIFKYLQQIM